MTDEFALVTTSVSADTEAAALARALVEHRLAACVQILPIRSIYRWKGTIEDDAERLLVCKIRTVDFEEVADVIRRHHRYEVPEIVMVAIAAGSAAYLAWLSESVDRPGE